MTLEEFDELANGLINAQKEVSLAAQELVYCAHEDDGTLFKKPEHQELSDLAYDLDRITLNAIQVIRIVRSNYKPQPESSQLLKLFRLIKRSFQNV